MLIYGLIGEKLSHSMSPLIHSYLSDYEYNLYEMPENEVGKFIRSLPQRSIGAVNVTIPYKKTVIPFLDVISPTAYDTGSVNTVISGTDGKLYGYNTDLFGFIYMLRHSGIDVLGKKAIVLGSGGASVTVCAALKKLGAHEIVVISRNGQDNYSNISRHFNADILINTTPVGMFPNNGDIPVSLQNFKNLSGVCDIIYNPSITRLLYEAQKNGIPNIGGMYMLVAQAKLACELFMQRTLCDNPVITDFSCEVDRITSAAEHAMKNILLIGMPGCGKSTLGRKIAEITGREFIDTDSIITKNAGISVPEILAHSGETEFRALENHAVSDASKKCGCVIATGGGAVLSDENRRMMKQNSYVVYIDRNINLLETKGRPLSNTADALRVIYKNRSPLYFGLCDIHICANGDKNSINMVAKKILEELGYENTRY